MHEEVAGSRLEFAGFLGKDGAPARGRRPRFERRLSLLGRVELMRTFAQLAEHRGDGVMGRMEAFQT